MAVEDIFDQRRWPHCTLFAVSLAISKACEDHGVEITSQEVRAMLLMYDDIFDKVEVGFFPYDFDGKTLKFYNRNPNAEEISNYTIKIQDMAPNEYQQGLQAIRYVLVVWRYLDGDEDHCMFVIDRIEIDGVNCFRCRNSMQDGGLEPLIEETGEENTLHRVTVTVNNRIFRN